MGTERSIDTLSKYIIYAVTAAIICGICWFFRDIIVYILLAGVLSLIGRPLMSQLCKIGIKGHRLPSWVAAVISIILILSMFLLIITLIVPVISNIAKDVSMVNVESTVKSISIPLQDLNEFLIEKYPNLGEDFRIEKEILRQVQKLMSISAFSSFVSSVTNFVTNFGIALFSVVFIAFFFFRDSTLFSRIIAALVPEKHERETIEAIGDIEHLLTRYFLGLLIEITGVATINFLGLMFIARLGFNASIGIAFITGILNLIPYVGPLTGGVIGTILGVVMKYICATHLGLDVSFWVFIVILIAIFSVTQLIDNFLFQPVIYSNSIKASPLEIFIILLMAGHLGGILGMLVAIPAYTVIRVFAGRFLRRFKFIRKLIPDPTENKMK